MATKRKRGKAWEFVVRRKKILPKPLYYTFDTEEEGDTYCARLEKLLDAGIVPEDLKTEGQSSSTVGDAVREYLRTVAVSSSDTDLLNVLLDREVAKRHLVMVSYDWAEKWVSEMKRVQRLSPTTIKHYVGALARCLDWVIRKNNPDLLNNPLRLLPKRYAQYTPADGLPVEEVQRDRRLEEGEEESILAILNGAKPEGKQRSLTLIHKDALICLFTLALETGMRLRESYTLTPDQINPKKKTIFLEKTKNGNKRQVPLSTIALKALREYDYFSKQFVFPWWTGDTSKRELAKITSKLSKQFDRIFKAASCDDLNYHDLRHEAACRVYERTTLTDIQVMKMFGWTDPRVCKRYANLRGSDLAARLW